MLVRATAPTGNVKTKTGTKPVAMSRAAIWSPSLYPQRTRRLPSPSAPRSCCCCLVDGWGGVPCFPWLFRHRYRSRSHPGSGDRYCQALSYGQALSTAPILRSPVICPSARLIISTASDVVHVAFAMNRKFTMAAA